MDYLIREHGTLFHRELAIENRHGERLYRVYGPVVRARDELRVDDFNGVEQAWIKEPVLSDRRTYEIYRNGAHTANITMVGVGNLLEGFDIKVLDGPTFKARGDMLGRDFTILGQTSLAARVKRHDGKTVQVETTAGQDEVLLLSGVVAISAMTDAWARASTHDNR
jgi:uncharacterized protein YxjI